MEIRKATTEDLEGFYYDGIEYTTVSALEWKSQLARYMALGPSWVGLKGPEKTFFAGYFEISQGVIQTWMLFNREAGSYAKLIAKEVREKIRDAFEKGYHRAQTFALEDAKDAQKYLRLMGFKREGTLEAFGPNKENMVVYKMVKS